MARTRPADRSGRPRPDRLRRGLILALTGAVLALSLTGCRLATPPRRRPEPPPPTPPPAPVPQASTNPTVPISPAAPGTTPAAQQGVTPAPSPPTPPYHPGTPQPLAGGTERMTRPPEDIEISRVYPGLVFRFGPSNKRQVALTFDDAPDNNFTPQILDVLKQQGVPATFFLVGSRVAQFPDVVKRMVQEGHAVGNHTYSHASLTKLTAQQQTAELARTDDIIEQVAGVRPRLFRPPYGSESAAVLQNIFKQGYRVILWDVDSLDWKSLPAGQVIDNDLNHAHNGAIFLHHAAGGRGEDLSGSIQALPTIITRLRDKGYQFVTVPTLLGIQP